MAAACVLFLMEEAQWQKVAQSKLLWALQTVSRISNSESTNFLANISQFHIIIMIFLQLRKKGFWANNALSFYRSQNILGWSKFFVSDQNIIYILCLSQTFCASPKDWVQNRHKSVWRGPKCSQIFGLAQKIWTGTKYFETCKRTSQKKFVWFSISKNWEQKFVDLEFKIRETIWWADHRIVIWHLLWRMEKN